jgi:hypothetical protein
VVFFASMLHGTARGEIQLPTAHRIAGLLNDELEGVAIAPDVPGAEMPADHQCRGIGETGEQFVPRHR